jgi:hypothetical protein
MSYFNKRKQKSPPRRFLLILGFALFICITGFGLMILFWDKLAVNLKLSQWNRIGFGALCIIYGIIRSARIYKRDVNED